jgi:virginiamycin A acetyltransferase
MRKVLKRISDVSCLALMFPAALVFRVQALLGGADAAFSGWSQFLSLIPGTIGVSLRRAFLRQTCGHCGRDVCVSFGSVFSSRDVRLGEQAYIGHFCSVGNVTIESDVLIASHVSIMNGCRQHSIDRLDIPVRDQTGVLEPVTIGRDSWIGEHATVAANVGRHCVIGAGALVLDAVPDYGIAVGVPARVIKDRRELVTADGASGLAHSSPASAPTVAHGVETRH